MHPTTQSGANARPRSAHPPAADAPSPPHRRGHPSSAPKALESYLVPRGRDPLTHAFARREFAPPWRGSVPVADEDAEATVAEVFATPRRAPAVAYLHVPYCQNQCLFCGFFANVWRPELANAFVDDVIAEIAEKARTPLVASAPIAAVYIGGGTPTALAAAPLARLIASLRELLPLTPDCEITLEGRSHDFGLAKAEAALAAGATRFSLGVQSFGTEVRRRLGRKLAGPEVKAFLSDLVRLDRASVVCDLIYGLPGQDATTWASDIATVDALGLDGATLYALNVWSEGPLARAVTHGKLPPAATLPEQAEAYAAAVAALTRAGWRQVAQAHLVRAPRERNRYNGAIKRGVACLPFGPGAGGQAHGVRWHNVVDVEQRRTLRQAGRLPVDGVARVPARAAAQAIITAGLESGTLDLAAVEAAAPGFRVAAAPLLQNWDDAGLGTATAASFRTTRAGAFWITNLTAGLFAALDGAAAPLSPIPEPTA